MPQLLSGLKELARRGPNSAKFDLKNLVAIVSAFDDGGSSGRLMETYDTLPPGDLRNCLVALADEQLEPLMTRFLNHRFGTEDQNDPLAGHSVGNLLLLALAQVYDGDMRQALLNVGRILPIQSRILFPTLCPATLCATLEDGTVIRGESKIGKRHNPSPVQRIFLEPRPSKSQGMPKEVADFKVPPMDGVLEALEAADLIALGPGSLYTSVLPHLLVDGIADIIRRRADRVVYICNIMNEPGETDHYGVADYIRALERHGGFTPAYVLVNHIRVSEEFYQAYAKERLEIDFKRLSGGLERAWKESLHRLEAEPLLDAKRALEAGIERLASKIGGTQLGDLQVLPPKNPPQTPQIIATDLLGSTQLTVKGKTKSVIRHDPVKLAESLIALL